MSSDRVSFLWEDPETMLRYQIRATICQEEPEGPKYTPLHYVADFQAYRWGEEVETTAGRHEDISAAAIDHWRESQLTAEDIAYERAAVRFDETHGGGL